MWEREKTKETIEKKHPRNTGKVQGDARLRYVSVQNF